MYQFLRKFGIILWILLILLTGTYFRTRPGDTVQLDWFVLIQLLVAALSIIVGLRLVKNFKSLRMASIVLFFYILAALLSAGLSGYPKNVLGYWVLLTGAVLLTISLVYFSKDFNEVKRLEVIFWIFITLILIKDATTSLFLWQEGNGLNRLGMGVTHANTLSFLAAIAFWMSFNDKPISMKSILWVLRIFFILIILLSRTRMSMFCFVFGGFCRYWYQAILYDRKNQFFARFLSISVFSIIGVLFLWFFVNQYSWANNTFSWINRGQGIERIETLTGRTYIWQISFYKIIDDLPNLILGHGYGMSRFVLNDPVNGAGFFINHAHNSFLEATLSMGIFSALSLIIIAIYSLKWIIKFRQITEAISFEFALRAVTIIPMILVYSMTEPVLAVKVSPIFIIFLFYILVLDRMEIRGLKTNL